MHVKQYIFIDIHDEIWFSLTCNEKQKNTNQAKPRLHVDKLKIILICQSFNFDHEVILLWWTGVKSLNIAEKCTGMLPSSSVQVTFTWTEHPISHIRWMSNTKKFFSVSVRTEIQMLILFSRVQKKFELHCTARKPWGTRCGRGFASSFKRESLNPGFALIYGFKPVWHQFSRWLHNLIITWLKRHYLFQCRNCVVFLLNYPYK